MVKYILKRFFLFLFAWAGITFIAYIGTTAANIRVWSFAHPFIDDLEMAFEMFKLYIQRMVEDGYYGQSDILGEPLSLVFERRVPVSLKLNLYAFLLYIPLGVVFGVIAARNDGNWIDKLISNLTLILGGVPSFLMMFFMVMVLGYTLNWFPPRYDPNPDGILEFIHVMFIPIMALTIMPMASTIRVVRAELKEEVMNDYILLLKAKGFSDRQILWRHALRSCLIPVAQDIPNHFGMMVTMSFIIEMNYNIQGIGYLFYQSVIVTGIDGTYLQLDPDTITMITFVYAGIILFVSFLGDASLSLLDPRINIKGKKV